MTEKLKLNLKHFADQTDINQQQQQQQQQTDGSEGQQQGDNQQQQDGDSKGDSEKTFTQEEVDQILKDRLAREKKSKEDAVKEAEKLAKMSKDQKAEYERKQLQEELNAYKAKEARNEMKQTAKGMLKEKDISADDELLTAETADQTSENVKAFTDVLNKMVKEQVQAKLTQSTPKNYQAQGTMTREQIMSISDDSQRQLAIANNRHLFD